MTITREDLDSGHIDLSKVATGRRMKPLHPGEILRTEFIEPLGLSSRTLAQALGVPANRVSEIVAGRRDITAETALRLERHFGASAQFWLGLQQDHDLELARRDHAAIIRRQVKKRAA